MKKGILNLENIYDIDTFIYKFGSVPIKNIATYNIRHCNVGSDYFMDLCRSMDIVDKNSLFLNVVDVFRRKNYLFKWFSDIEEYKYIVNQYRKNKKHMLVFNNLMKHTIEYKKYLSNVYKLK